MLALLQEAKAPEPGPTGEGPGFRHLRRKASETLLVGWS
jgi:hypothetical protein